MFNWALNAPLQIPHSNISEIFVVYQHKGYLRDNHLTLS